MSDGRGLNPLLQDPWMVSHPPTLFLGYAGYTVPFAFLLGALVAGRRDNLWLGKARPWIMVSWIFLTLGIVLGALWAYVELAFGGYWAWDPVENASLLPWLTGTALVHSIMAQQHRGMLKIWNAALIALTFLLCIFGTYLTRSGVVASVHTFPESPIGNFFLFVMALIVAVSVGMILWRLPLLRSERSLEALTSKEGLFLLTNILLVGIMLATVWGTMYPRISDLFGEPQNVQQAFYNKKVVPLALVLVGLMAVAPLLAYGRPSAERGRKLRQAVVVGALGVVIAAVLVLALLANSKAHWVHAATSWLPLEWGWSAVCSGIVVVGLVAIVWDLIRGIIERVSVQGENPIVATVRLLDGNHRRYGGQVVHIGMLMIVAGVAGSSLFKAETAAELRPGQTLSLKQYQLTLNETEPVQGPNYRGRRALVSLAGPEGMSEMLRPEVRRFDKWAQQQQSELAIRSTWREDVYVQFLFDERSGAMGLKVIVNPLISWIWIGGVLMTLGAVACLVPRLEPRAWRVKESAPAPAGAEAKPAIAPGRKAVAGA